jgi:hypothetical protein
MADFFSRIAERALSVAPIVKPNLPPMFAPMPLIETSAEVVTPQAPWAADNFPSTGDMPRGWADPAIADRTTQVLAQEHQLLRTVSQRPEVSPSLVDARRERSALPPEAPERKSLWVPEPVVTKPTVAATSGLETLSPRRSDAAPTVQVTIGRVEVRAVMPPVQTPRAIERKSPQLFSLEEYLRERNGRHR